MEKIYRAGIIPFYIEKSKIYMLFMKPSDPRYGGNSFQIAKGKCEDNETAEKTALREGFEELGLIEDNVEELINAGIHLGRTTIFLARIKDKDRFEKFHFETDETRWFSLEEFEKIGRKIHIPIVREIVNQVITE